MTSSSEKPWTVDRLLNSMGGWCHHDESRCPHSGCSEFCTGKAVDGCMAEPPEENEDADVPPCHPDTCELAELEALLAVVRGLLEVPGNRELAAAILAKHLGGEGT